jgi:hypothetical protein
LSFEWEQARLQSNTRLAGRLAANEIGSTGVCSGVFGIALARRSLPLRNGGSQARRKPSLER